MRSTLPARFVLPVLTAVLVTGLGAAVALQPVPARAGVPVARAAALPVTAPAPAAPAAVAVVVTARVEAASTGGRTARTGTGRPVAGGRSPAGAPLTVQQRGERALAALGLPWQRLGYSVAFAPYTGGRLGTTSSRTRSITVFVKAGQDETELRATIAHEIGHALDFVHGTNTRRAEYRRIRGLPTSGRWFPCNGCEDFASPAGDWSEVFAAALVGNGDFRSRMAGPPSAAQLRELRALFAIPSGSAQPEPAPAPAEQQPAPGPTAEPEPDDEPQDDEPQDDDGLLPVGRGVTA